MTRSTSKKTALTSAPNPALTRQARRLTKQQKRLANDMMAESSDYIPTKTSSRGRAITEKDIKDIQPMSDMQAEFFNTFDEADAMVLYGSAGTGKTFLSAALGILSVLDPESPYDKLLFIRSVVPTRDIGFLSGNEEKLAPYEEPYHQIFSELCGRKDAYDKLKDMGKVDFAISSFLRGLTFNNTIIIVDEFQSMNWHELQTICTRVGKSSKIIFTGDGRQDDLIKTKYDTSGFRDFMKVASSMKEFAMFEFTDSDIVRSGFVRSFITACNRNGL